MKHTEDFKREAVRIALNSGLSRTRIASDLGIDKSTLGKWIVDYRPTEPASEFQTDPSRKIERLRLENRILREEREILKKRPSSSRAKSHEVRIHPSVSA